MRISTFWVSAAFVLLLSACGQTSPLRPQEGASLPPAAYGAPAQPRDGFDAEALMTPSAQAKPVAEDELLRRSERRTLDPFDLPPGYVEPPVEENAAVPGNVPIGPRPDDPAPPAPLPPQ